MQRTSAIDWFTTRTAMGRTVAALAAELRARRAPVHWSNMFGVVALACILVIFVTGFFLMFFYSPSSTTVTYRGSYAPLDGVEMSTAMHSTMTISFDLRGGLLMRQAHHWAALLLPTALILQLLVTFFTGAFRKPRLGSWVLLFLILITALVGGWSGYALPDDMLSGTGLRIVEGIVLGIPIVGTWTSALLFGGPFPGDIIAHLYPLHIVVVPVLLVVLVAARIRSAWVHKPAQFAEAGRTEDNVVGVPILPNAAVRAGGLFLIVAGLLVLVAATTTISPIWLYGPSSPADASAGSQPDWYTGFLDGALRLIPPGWEVVWLSHTWTFAVIVPLALVGLYLLAVLLYPFFEQWITGDRREHHLLDRPRNTPTRTGIGVAGIVFFGALWGAASADLAATHLHLSVENVVTAYQVIVIVGPVIAFLLARRICFALQRKDREILLHGHESGRIVRFPGGEYVEIHKPADAYERWRLIAPPGDRPLELHPDADGRIRLTTRLRARISRFFFEDRIAPDLDELDAS
ncbi:cytochrome bc1 complex cytochrome b subunit [Leifsonella bigeumensis]